MANQVTRQDFLRAIKSQSTGRTNAPPSSISLDRSASQVTAPTAGDQTTQRNVLQRVTAPFPSETFEQRHQRLAPDGTPVPLDTDTGAPFGIRSKLSFAPDAESGMQMLRSAFAGATVEAVEGDQFIIRGVLDPETQQVKDLLVDEQGFSMKDAADLASVVPEMAGALAAIIATRSPLGAIRGRAIGAKSPTARRVGKLGHLAAESAVAATGAQTTGAALDTAVRMAQGQPAQPGETLRRRGQAALAETALGVGMGIPLLSGQALFNRIGFRRGRVQQEGMPAIDRLADATGIRIRTSFGQETGSTIALKTEAIVSKTPTGGGFLRKQTAATLEDLQAIQLHLQGDAPLLTEGDIGLEAVATLRQYTDALEQGINLEVRNLGRQAMNDLNDRIAQSTGIEKSVFKLEGGRAVRGAIVERETAFRQTADELFARIDRDLPIDTAPLQKRLESIRERELIKGTKITSEEGLVLDPVTGKPIVTTTEGREVIEEFVPANLKRFFSGTAKLDPETPLSELRTLRTQINDAVNQAEILEGVPNRLLKEFSNSITETIEAGVEKLDPTMANRLREANEFYRTNIEKFQTKGIIEFLADPTQRRLADRAVTTQLMDPDRYFQLKEMLTNPLTLPDGTVVNPGNNAAWNTAKRSIITHIEEVARLSGDGELINGDTFLKEVQKIITKDPEMANDLFGPSVRAVVDDAKTIKATQGKLGKMNIDELLESMGSSRYRIGTVQKIAAKQQQLDDLYHNNVIKKFVKGEVGEEAINSGEFIDRYLDIASPDELSRVMAGLSDNPKLLGQIRRKTIQKLFQNSERPLTGEDVFQGLSDDPAVAVDFKKMFANYRGQKDKLKLVLGDDTARVLEDFMRASTLVGEGDAAAQAVGGLIGGSLLKSIMTLNISSMPQHAWYWLMGQVMSSPTLRPLFRPNAAVDVTRGIQSLGGATVLDAILTSAPVIEAATEDFGKSAGALMLDQLARAGGLLDDAAQPESTQSIPQGQMTREEFLRGIQGNQ